MQAAAIDDALLAAHRTPHTARQHAGKTSRRACSTCAIPATPATPREIAIASSPMAHWRSMSSNDGWARLRRMPIAELVESE
jgi:hypothetical protein